MENEIMKNEELVETTTEIAEAGSDNSGLIIAAGLGLAMVAGGLLDRFVVGPVIAKIKARKSGIVVDAEGRFTDEDDFDDVFEETEEAPEGEEK